MKNINLPKNTWKKAGVKNNIYLKMNAKGQFEIIGHIASENEISDVCKNMYDTLNREWNVIQEKKQLRQIPEQNQSHLFDLDLDKTALETRHIPAKPFSKFKELYPLDRSANKTA